MMEQIMNYVQPELIVVAIVLYLWYGSETDADN